MAITRSVSIFDSSQVNEVHYDPSAMEMRVKFANGETYTYLRVPNSIFGQLVSSMSVGKTINEIKKNFEFRKLDKSA